MNPSQQRALSGNSSQFTDPPLKAAPLTSTTITQTQPLTSPLEVHNPSPVLWRSTTPHQSSGGPQPLTSPLEFHNPSPVLWRSTYCLRRSIDLSPRKLLQTVPTKPRRTAWRDQWLAWEGRRRPRSHAASPEREGRRQEQAVIRRVSVARRRNWGHDPEEEDAISRQIKRPPHLLQR
jgi:hypothetical protein